MWLRDCLNDYLESLNLETLFRNFGPLSIAFGSRFRFQGHPSQPKAQNLGDQGITDFSQYLSDAYPHEREQNTWLGTTSGRSALGIEENFNKSSRPIPPVSFVKDFTSNRSQQSTCTQGEHSPEEDIRNKLMHIKKNPLERVLIRDQLLTAQGKNERNPFQVNLPPLSDLETMKNINFNVSGSHNSNNEDNIADMESRYKNLESFLGCIEEFDEEKKKTKCDLVERFNKVLEDAAHDTFYDAICQEEEPISEDVYDENLRLVKTPYHDPTFLCNKRRSSTSLRKYCWRQPRGECCTRRDASLVELYDFPPVSPDELPATIHHNFDQLIGESWNTERHGEFDRKHHFMKWPSQLGDSDTQRRRDKSSRASLDNPEIAFRQPRLLCRGHETVRAPGLLALPYYQRVSSELKYANEEGAEPAASNRVFMEEDKDTNPPPTPKLLNISSTDKSRSSMTEGARSLRSMTRSSLRQSGEQYTSESDARNRRSMTRDSLRQSGERYTSESDARNRRSVTRDSRRRSITDNQRSSRSNRRSMTGGVHRRSITEEHSSQRGTRNRLSTEHDFRHSRTDSKRSFERDDRTMTGRDFRHSRTDSKRSFERDGRTMTGRDSRSSMTEGARSLRSMTRSSVSDMKREREMRAAEHGTSSEKKARLREEMSSKRKLAIAAGLETAREKMKEIIPYTYSLDEAEFHDLCWSYLLSGKFRKYIEGDWTPSPEDEHPPLSRVYKVLSSQRSPPYPFEKYGAIKKKLDRLVMRPFTNLEERTNRPKVNCQFELERSKRPSRPVYPGSDWETLFRSFFEGSSLSSKLKDRSSRAEDKKFKKFDLSSTQIKPFSADKRSSNPQCKFRRERERRLQASIYPHKTKELNVLETPRSLAHLVSKPPDIDSAENANFMASESKWMEDELAEETLVI